MAQYINKDVLVAEIERIDKSIGCDRFLSEYEKGCNQGKEEVCDTLRNFLDTLEPKESDETAEAFARIIRANLTGIDKDVQYKFEQLYKEVTGDKMYQGYND